MLEGYKDLSANDEDTRIGIIGNELMKRHVGTVLGICVDTEPEDAKAKRYFQKLQARFPEAQLVDICHGPTPGVTTIRIVKLS